LFLVFLSKMFHSSSSLLSDCSPLSYDSSERISSRLISFNSSDLNQFITSMSLKNPKPGYACLLLYI
jgi:hypothetical protein